MKANPDADKWRAERQAVEALYLLDLIRQWLDFIAWFLPEHATARSAKYEWFVQEFPPGSRDDGVTAQVTDPVIDFSFRYRAGDATSRISTAYFQGGQRREVPMEDFCAYLQSEVRDSGRVCKLAGRLPPWYPRDDIFPRGVTPAELHADYLDVRQKVLDFYRQIVSEAGVERPPFTGFPEPVPLSAESVGPVVPAPPPGRGATGADKVPPPDGGGATDAGKPKVRLSAAESDALRKAFEDEKPRKRRREEADVSTVPPPSAPPNPPALQLKNGGITYDGRDLALGGGMCLTVFRRLTRAKGKRVTFKRLDRQSFPNNASPQLRRAVSKINKALEAQDIPFRVISLYGEGYVLKPCRV